MLVLLFFLSFQHYFGYHYFYKYKKARTEAESIEKSFPFLERNLKKAVWFSKNPLFYKELARLYLERAFGENEFGTGERRDFFCDLAREALAAETRRNPIDPFAYYEMGKVYMLYNYPLLTYAEKGRLYMRKALELRPADEFLSLNILYIFLTQWDALKEGEKAFIFEQLKRERKDKLQFLERLYRRWTKNAGNDLKIKEIISRDESLWLEMSRFFK